jgi:glutathione S-transferase
MAVHIALREAGLKPEIEKVDLGTHKTESGKDFYAINPKGYVPALQLDNGEVLTEAGVCLQYVADQAPQSGLAPKAGTMERYRLMEWINYISTEVHKTFGPLFNPAITPEARQAQVDMLGKKFDYLAKRLSGSPYLTGDKYTAADAYLFTVLGWSGFLKVDLSKWPVLKEFSARVAERPAVKEAMKAEGLLK